MKGKIFLLYDSRRIADENAGIVFEVCETLKEAKENAPSYGDDTIIVEAETEGNEIVSERICNQL